MSAMPPRFPWRWSIMREIPGRGGISIIGDWSRWRVDGGVFTELLYAVPSEHTPSERVIETTSATAHFALRGP
jgi:hypothetical protein